ncbi:methyltransferase domain-containing protein [Phytohabitans rumicis]|uniref:methyltransferase domain-containing protein n=1 Tax=Phytohabitans rumicis TaxID=1076125 RepID=UPI0031E5CCDD
MPDVYATISRAATAVTGPLAEILELRGADPQQQAMRRAYLSDVEFPPAARVVEIGCGPGPVARFLAGLPGVGSVVGVDPSPYFLARGRELARDLPNVTFVAGDGRAVPLGDQTVDVVVFHTTLCHIPGPERALAEAYRLLRPGGWLAVFDGDYMTISCATSDHDPLQACADATAENLIHDRWLGRRLPGLVRGAGFEQGRLRGHSYVEAPSSGAYLLAIIDRGADALLAGGRVGPDLAAALKAEARRRSDAGEFFGHIGYVSVVARRPALPG